MANWIDKLNKETMERVYDLGSMSERSIDDAFSALQSVDLSSPDSSNDPFYDFSDSDRSIDEPEDWGIHDWDDPASVVAGAGFGEGSSTTGSPGIYLRRTNGTWTYVSNADIIDGYNPGTDNNWSLRFAVSGGALTAAAPTGTTSTTPYDGNAFADPIEAQTFYSLPVVRTITVGGVSTKFQWDVAGIYRENIFCDTTLGPIVELIKIG